MLTVRHGNIVMLRGKVTVEICEVNDVPIAFEGHAPFNVQNAMAAAAAATAHGVEIDDIRAGLLTFHPTPAQMPGRTNYFEADGVKCLIDYGHNVPALKALRAAGARAWPRSAGSVWPPPPATAATRISRRWAPSSRGCATACWSTRPTRAVAPRARRPG